MRVSKHIKKKYQFEWSIKEEDHEFIKTRTQDLRNDIKIPNDHFAVLINDTKAKAAFALYHNKKQLKIPIPDFTLVHFNKAYNSWLQEKDYKQQLFEAFSNDESFNHDHNTLLYNYYGEATSFIINLFTSIESFINHQISKNDTFTETTTFVDKHYNFDQIQWLSFDVKIKKVLPVLKGRNFFTNTTKSTQLIDKLKDLRNSIIHTKSHDTVDPYTDIIKSLMKYPYEDTLDAVAKFFNYYKPDYVELCPCNNEY